MWKTLVIVPCHNEELSISATIAELSNNVPNLTIWVIDNLSTDLTGTKAAEAGAVVLPAPQKGKGFAVRHAFARIPADYDVIFMIDGDDTYDSSAFLKAAGLVMEQGYDMIVGSRSEGEDVGQDRTVVFRAGHAAGNRILSKVFQVLFGLYIADTLSGWRVMSPGFVKSFSGGASEFEIEAELNAHAYLLNAAVSSIPVVYRGRQLGSVSKLNTYRDGFKILRRQIQLFRSERPLIAYSALGIPWFVTSVLLVKNVLSTYIATHLVPNFPSLIAGVGCFIAASLLWVTGMILEKVRLTRVALARSIYSQFTCQEDPHRFL